MPDHIQLLLLLIFAGFYLLAALHLIDYLNDHLCCTVCGGNMCNRLRDCYTLRKSLAHVRNPEKHTDLAHLMSAGR